MFGVERATPNPNGLVEVAIRAVFENEVNMASGLERVNQVDNVGVVPNSSVNSELFGFLVDSDGGGTGISSGILGKALQCYKFAGEGVVSFEDHAKGAMVERRDGPVSSI